jgi:formylglycine-generating enzyme required for sulfatase activity
LAPSLFKQTIGLTKGKRVKQRHNIGALWGCLFLAVFAGTVEAQTPAPNYKSAPGSARDPVTGLPTRIIHQPSGITFVLIPAGDFLMGSPPGEEGRLRDEDQHRRVVRQPFYLGETEVTVAQFRRFVQATGYQTDAESGTPVGGHMVGSFATVAAGDRDWSAMTNWRNPFPNLRDYRLRNDHPVVHISWNDAQRFCAQFGLKLPTEAQWEYAVRAGTQTRYFWGDQEADGKSYANVADLLGRQRFRGWNQGFSFSDGVTLLASVRRYRPNAWGLYDMVGNALEWVEDDYIRCYPGDGADEAAARADSDTGHVLRGGSWIDAPAYGRSAVRVTMASAARRDFIGFRVTLPIKQEKENKQ